MDLFIHKTTRKGKKAKKKSQQNFRTKIKDSLKNCLFFGIKYLVKKYIYFIFLSLFSLPTTIGISFIHSPYIINSSFIYMLFSYGLTYDLFIKLYEYFNKKSTLFINFHKTFRQISIIIKVLKILHFIVLSKSILSRFYFQAI